MRFLFNNVESGEIKSYEAFRLINNERAHNVLEQRSAYRMAMLIDFHEILNNSMDKTLAHMARNMKNF